MFLYLAAILIVFTALLHSIMGEKRLITPLLNSDIPLVRNEVARPVIRFAWHATSALWLIIAAFLAKMAFLKSHDNDDLILLVGVSHIVLGACDGIISKGRHVGWPPITLIGMFSILGVYFS